MSLTQAQFRYSMRKLMPDEDTWPDATLNQWLKEAIRDYSVYFPYRATHTSTPTAGSREITLSAGGETLNILSVVSVEYPTGETPARYLSRMSRFSPNFYGQAVYDVDFEPVRKVWLGETPDDTDALSVELHVTHTLPSSDSSTLTIPDNHFEALKLFVQWQAIKVLELDESIDPNDKTLLLTTFGLNAVRAERLYRGKIDEYISKAAVGGVVGPWLIDHDDRIY